MKLTYALLTITLMVIIPFTEFASADVPPSQKPEVEYLLEYVRTTDCSFDRNGKIYDGQDAYKHIKRKYDHYKKDITSTETFIEYSATKSMISGKDYYVTCPGRPPVRSQDWLLSALEEFRQSAQNK